MKLIFLNLIGLWISFQFGFCVEAAIAQVNSPESSLEKPSSSVVKGMEFVFQIKPKSSHSRLTKQKIESTKQIITKRLQFLKINPVTITNTNHQIIVRIPQPVNDINQIIDNITQRGNLEFRQQRQHTQPQFSQLFRHSLDLEANLLIAKKGFNQQIIADYQRLLDNNRQAIARLFIPTQLTSKYIQNAVPELSYGQVWSIAISFDRTGEKLFTNLTKKMAGTGLSIGIFIDNKLISAPVVSKEFAKTGITGGKAVITGNFTQQDAEKISIQLLSGTLPVDLEIVEMKTYRGN